ncbi:flagellar basal body L-ring protein FlgH [Achromobacter xylosoxidans]|uniref:flagellar basal body L-ring protein FlgH n=2 Tax=Alcaligenes xylosoxydans xylosoxydans TaxID=85698 RepID=UPI0004B3FA94|nr:flagellar basal body L-ring protein FlgH [Achromobacter xylosoxidans]MCH4594193.1 flagellar basal body L-ring protein FlgH [Achromobacter xylosoxidans]MCZ8384109.1 flagellar basal body L-ring protein FlgH [Achromobacter xylosoxidans]
MKFNPVLARAMTPRAVGLALVLALVTAGARAESLYDPALYRSLGTDRKAARIGDVLTIQVVETSSATSSADTSTGRKSSIDAEFRLSRRPTTAGGLEVDSDFEGGGKTQRSGRLLAQMSVNVVDIAPNGDLYVKGDQLLTVNDEQQKIHVKGRVRPQDISPGNVVLSTRLAQAEIVYMGEGELAGRQRPAWWNRFLNWLGF